MAAKKKAKGKTTTYNQTIKGHPAQAKTFTRQGNLLGNLITNRRQGMANLEGQYTNALDRNKATRKSVVGDLLKGFETAKEGYERSNTDAEVNLGQNVSASMLNRAREGSNAMAELSNMQAGETDRIKGMSASIRAMKANMDGGASDYASAITSINNSLGDLNSSVSGNINNALREENTNNASAYGEYSAGQQQGYADLVDLYGQRGAAYESAADAIATKNSKTSSKGTKNITTTQTDKTIYGKLGKADVGKAKDAFAGASSASKSLADSQSNTYKTPIMTIDEMNAENPDQAFHEAAMKENKSNLDELANAGTLRKLAGPQGSKLRKVDF